MNRGGVRAILAGVLTLAATLGAPPAEGDEPLRLRYAQPAERWTEALPVGNGRLGAMVFGGVATERLQLNEATLWSGGPTDWNNPGARDVLPQVRAAIFAGDYVKATELAKKMQGPYNQSYQPLGDLRLSFSGDAAVTPAVLRAEPRPRPRGGHRPLRGRGGDLHARGLQQLSRSGDRGAPDLRSARAHRL